MNDFIVVPHFDSHARFYNDLGEMSNNPNSLAGSKPEPDEAAVFSVLQFGAIVPPLSPWKGVRRFKPGYRYHGIKATEPERLNLTENHPPWNVEEKSHELDRLLDDDLRNALNAQPNPVLLFSGGVDSGLLASRLANLECRNVLLLNYSFQEVDPESLLAEAMAKHLGLRFERISAKRALCDCLEKPGQIYPQPFGDHSTVPTFELACASVDQLRGKQCLILDGTGADGGFGMTNKLHAWARVGRVPAFLRQWASLIYSVGLWRRKGGVEHLFRVLRRSVDMPLLSAVLAQNPLAGCLYQDAASNDVHELLSDWVGGWVGQSLPHRIVAADLALTCANTFAQKGQPIFESGGHKVHYPFLQNPVVALALSSIGHFAGNEPKAALKRSLARDVPHKMVYRPKSGFVDPRAMVFFDPAFLTHFRAAADASSPLSGFLKQKALVKACDLLANKASLPSQTLNCIWAITFMDRWYRTVPRKSALVPVN